MEELSYHEESMEAVREHNNSGARLVITLFGNTFQAL